MVKFTIRHLLVLVAIAAICALLIRTDWVAALGFVLSVSYLTIAFSILPATRPRRWNLAIRGFASLPGLILLWFSTVDYSSSIDWCRHCSVHRYVSEYRACGVPVWAKLDDFHANNVHRLRADLGFPCSHKFDKQHLIRAWGLLYCARPCTCVLCCFSSDPDYYNESVSQEVRQFALEKPADALKLYQQVVHEKNYDAMNDFIDRLKEQGRSE